MCHGEWGVGVVGRAGPVLSPVPRPPQREAGGTRVDNARKMKLNNNNRKTGPIATFSPSLTGVSRFRTP